MQQQNRLRDFRTRFAVENIAPIYRMVGYVITVPRAISGNIDAARAANSLKTIFYHLFFLGRHFDRANLGD